MAWLTDIEIAQQCQMKHIDEIAKAYNIPVLARIPMDPELALATDAGKIEDYENDYMKDAIEAIKNL